MGMLTLVHTTRWRHCAIFSSHSRKSLFSNFNLKKTYFRSTIYTPYDLLNRVVLNLNEGGHLKLTLFLVGLVSESKHKLKVFYYIRPQCT